MRLIKPLETWTKDDVEQLVADRVREDRFLEYKREPYKPKDDQDLCTDASAFANAAGGHLLLGVDEERDERGKPTGVPVSAPGIRENGDEVVRRVEQVLRNGSVDPRIPGLRVRAIDGLPDGPVIVIHVPKSWAAPHMVCTSSRFNVRTGAGNHPMDAQEIREAFLLGAEHASRPERFRQERVSATMSGIAPFPVGDRGVVLLHVGAISALHQGQLPDITSPLDPTRLLLRPMGTPGSDFRRNFDGFLTFGTGIGGGRAYAQVFRRGIVEFASSALLHQQRLRLERVVEDCLDCTTAALGLLHRAGVERPYFALVTVAGCRGLEVCLDEHRSRIGVHAIDVNNLFVPEVLFEDQVSVAEVLAPAFHQVAQAFGIEQAPGFSASGDWRAPRGRR
ncbi:MAG TPA: ATP-binding protein [Thermoleophilia bacterium]|nr:ATP-binding protein [Thermoleophilia bacterium]